MTSRMTAPIEWAGVAIRLADGMTYAFELEEAPGFPLLGDIQVEALMWDATTSFDTYRRMEPTGDRIADIRLKGRARHSARFQQTANEHKPRPAIAERQHELSGGTDR